MTDHLSAEERARRWDLLESFHSADLTTFATAYIGDVRRLRADHEALAAKNAELRRRLRPVRRDGDE